MAGKDLLLCALEDLEGAGDEADDEPDAGSGVSNDGDPGRSPGGPDEVLTGDGLAMMLSLWL